MWPSDEPVGRGIPLPAAGPADRRGAASCYVGLVAAGWALLVLEHAAYAATPDAPVPWALHAVVFVVAMALLVVGGTLAIDVARSPWHAVFHGRACVRTGIFLAVPAVVALVSTRWIRPDDGRTSASLSQHDLVALGTLAAVTIMLALGALAMAFGLAALRDERRWGG